MADILLTRLPCLYPGDTGGVAINQKYSGWMHECVNNGKSMNFQSAAGNIVSNFNCKGITRELKGAH